MSVEEYNPPRGRKIGSVKLPKTKKKKTEDPVIAKANNTIRALEDEADKVKAEFLNSTDEIFYP
jgi:hypothetical protein